MWFGAHERGIRKINMPLLYGTSVRGMTNDIEAPRNYIDILSRF